MSEELELTQLLYEIFGRTTEIVGRFVADQRQRYDWSQVATMMHNFDSYLTKHPIGKESKIRVPRLRDKLSVATQALVK